MKRKPVPANKSARYRAFIHNRDLMLEALHIKAHQKINDVLRGTFTHLIERIVFRYTMAPPASMLADPTHFTSLVDKDIVAEFSLAARDVAVILAELKIHAYTLAVVGEAEAIGRAEDKPTLYHVDKKEIEEDALYDFEGKPITTRIDFAFDKLRRKILNAVQLARINEDSTKDMIERVKRALPSSRAVRRPARILKTLKEARVSVNGQEMTILQLGAKGDDTVNLAQGFMDDELWEQLLEEYLTEYVPQYREPKMIFDVEVGGDTEEWYGWEIEQYVAHDFVDRVRKGQDEAAKQNGITDFMWIAVIDDKTDECCAWRDGLTSAQIEAKLPQHRDDECDVIVPPAHFNCRCTVAPMLDTMTDEPTVNVTEFEEWLNS